MSQCKACSSHRQKEWVKKVHAGEANQSLEEYKIIRNDYSRAKLNRMTPEERLHYFAKGRAVKSGLEFNIEISDIIIPEVCPIFNILLDKENARKLDKKVRYSPNLPSIDRIDSSKGYIKGNVEIISWRANKIKNDATYEELVLMGKYAEQKLIVGVT